MTVDPRKLYQGIDVQGGNTDADGSIIRGQLTVDGIFENDQFFPLSELDVSTDSAVTTIRPNGGVIVPTSSSGMTGTGSITVSGIVDGNPTNSPNTRVTLRLSNSETTLVLLVMSVTSNAAFATALTTRLNGSVGLGDDYIATIDASDTSVINITATNVGTQFNATFTVLSDDDNNVILTGVPITGGVNSIVTSNTSGLTKYYINRTTSIANIVRSEGFPVDMWGEWFIGGGSGGGLCTVTESYTAIATWADLNREKFWDEANAGFVIRVTGTNQRITHLCGYLLQTPIPISFEQTAAILVGSTVMLTITGNNETITRTRTVTSVDSGGTLVISSGVQEINPFVNMAGNVADYTFAFSLTISSAFANNLSVSTSGGGNTIYRAPRLVVEARPQQGILRFDDDYNELSITRNLLDSPPHFPTSYVDPATFGFNSFTPAGRTVLNYNVTITGSQFSKKSPANAVILREAALYTNATNVMGTQGRIDATNSIITDFRYPIVLISVTPEVRGTGTGNITTGILNGYVRPDPETLFPNRPANNLAFAWPNEPFNNNLKTVKIFAIPTAFRISNSPLTIIYRTDGMGQGFPTTTQYFTTIPFGLSPLGVDLTENYDLYQFAVGQPGAVTYFPEFS